MAKYPRLTGSRKISQDYNKVNEALDMIEQDVSYLEDGIIDVAKEVTETQQSTAQSVNSLQTQINTLVINGDSSAAAAQAAVDANGYNYGNLKRRLDEEHTQITEQLAETEQKIENVMSLPIGLPKEMLQKIKELLAPPTNFTWKDAPINIYKTLYGDVTTDFEASDFKVTGGVTYYVKLNGGSDANDGLTPETALRTISIARNKPDVGTIIVYDGYYNDDRGLNNATTVNKSFNLIAAEGADVTISTKRDVSWSKTAGYTNVYQATRSLTAAVYDSSIVDEFGDYAKLKSVNSIELVDTTQGSYYFDSSNNVVYIHTADSRAADSSLYVYLDIYNLYNVGNHVVYCEGIKFHGGKSGGVHFSNSSSSDTPLFVAKDCEFSYSTGGNGGLTILGAVAYFQNCVAAGNARDGFNYHAANGQICKFIEVNCKGRHNGIGRGANTDNGSTAHDGCIGIRINCTYHHNEGPNCHDVDAGTQSWNLGIESHTSVATASARRANYQIENGEMWLDTCIGYESQRAYVAGSGSTLYLKNCAFDNGEKFVNTDNGAEVEYY